MRDIVASAHDTRGRIRAQAPQCGPKLRRQVPRASRRPRTLYPRPSQRPQTLQCQLPTQSHDDANAGATLHKQPVGVRPLSSRIVVPPGGDDAEHNNGRTLEAARHHSAVRPAAGSVAAWAQVAVWRRFWARSRSHRSGSRRWNRRRLPCFRSRCTLTRCDGRLAFRPENLTFVHLPAGRPRRPDTPHDGVPASLAASVAPGCRGWRPLMAGE